MKNIKIARLLLLSKTFFSQIQNTLKHKANNTKPTTITITTIVQKMNSIINPSYITLTLFFAFASMNLYTIEAAPSKLRGAVRRSINDTAGGERRTLSEENGWCPKIYPGLNTSTQCELTGTQVGDCYYDPAGNLTISTVHNDIEYKTNKVDKFGPSVLPQENDVKCVCKDGLLTCE
jgi:hypothetical protein